MKELRGILAAIVVVAALSGCGQQSGIDMKAALRSANYTMALSCLKQIQVASSVFQMESEGKFPTLAEIEQRHYLSRLDILEAWDQREKPVPLSGYLFCEVVEDSDGSPINLRKKCGYAAYPASGNAPGGTVLLLLSNPDTAPAPAGQDGYASHGEEWTFYVADAGKVTLPVRRFPDNDSLGTVWIPLKKRTPEEALREAQDLANKAR